MEKSNLNSRREFLQKMLDTEEKTSQYYKVIILFKNISEWSAGW